MYYFFRKLLEIFFHIKYKINVVNKENIPTQKGGYIIAANHQFYTDPPLIGTCIKGKFSFMAKSELFHKNPIFTFIIKSCGAFPVVRGAGDGSAIEMSVEKLEKGRILVIFPEGTRSKDGTIGRAKSGVALIAGKANAAVLPVYIRYTDKKHIDFAVGKLIPAEKLAIDELDRTQIRTTATLIMDSVKALQKQVVEEFPTSK